MLSIVLSLKVANFMLYEFTRLLKFIPSFSFYYTSTLAFFKKFLKPVYYLMIQPFEFLGAQAYLTYSDLMIVILFGLVGTSFQQGNAFVEFMFMYSPAVLSALNYLQF